MQRIDSEMDDENGDVTSQEKAHGQYGSQAQMWQMIHHKCSQEN